MARSKHPQASGYSRAPPGGALFCRFIFATTHLLILFGLCLPAHAQSLCPPASIDETATVRSVSDGDTLRLADGRKIRLIGINTPELARDGKAAQALAQNAKNELQHLLQQTGNRVGLEYGRERFDTYQRTLAHVYLPNGSSVQAEMLLLGVATAYTTPPNDGHAPCYRETEHRARQQQRGLWALADYQLKTVNQLAKQEPGFRRIQGRVNRINLSPNATWLVLDEKLQIRIAADDRVYFQPGYLENFKNKMVEVRGWVHPDKHQANGFFMQLRHPNAISPMPH